MPPELAKLGISARDWEQIQATLRAEHAGSAGSWNSREAGRVYGTTMMTLAFTVPWRQLPIYQRDESVDETDP